MSPGVQAFVGVLTAIVSYKGGDALWNAISRIHAKKRDADLAVATLAERRAAREDDDSKSLVLDANAERRATMRKVEEQAAEITRLSVAVARCEEKHVASEAREREKDEKIEEQHREIASLRIDLDMTRQLADRQREEITKLDGDVASLTTQLADMRDSFDAFVKTAMGVRSISEVPGE